ncbi:flagellar type III secretion system pore protein FliP [Pelagibacterium nitratireducens]|uniref:flagellar type III secretion system pore protein FliP n=1 Tax=Pelagibacterium nitratireducens TaxID=1046114 RepID=UPI003BB0F23A
MKRGNEITRTPQPGPDTAPRRAGTPRAALVLALGLAAVLLLPATGIAQDISIDFGDETTLTERAIQMIALITILALAPSILVMVTSFTRIVVVLSLLRTAIGLQTAPPNSVMISLALFLTAFIMAPTLQQSYELGIEPLVAGEVEIVEAIELGSGPLHEFMRTHVRPQDVMLFMDLTETPAPENPEDLELRILIPAFMISELRRAFEIGFLLFLPFVVIDMVVASVLMSMGMMMLPPVIISLPFKLIFFVLVDGWHLVAGSLIRSFTG